MPIAFAEYATRVQEHLERFYGIPVVIRDIPDPLTGDLDGSEISADKTTADSTLHPDPQGFPHGWDCDLNGRTNLDWDLARRGQ